VKRDPAAANEILAELMMDAGRPGDAKTFAERSVEQDPSRYMSHFMLGEIARVQGRCPEAIGEYERAIAEKGIDPRAVVRNLHAGHADCLARGGRQQDAEKEFQAELAAVPWSPEARVGLATLYRSQGRDADAHAVLGGLVAASPNPDAETYWIVVRAFRALGDRAAAAEWASQAREKFPRDARFR